MIHSIIALCNLFSFLHTLRLGVILSIGSWWLIIFQFLEKHSQTRWFIFRRHSNSLLLLSGWLKPFLSRIKNSLVLSWVTSTILFLVELIDNWKASITALMITMPTFICIAKHINNRNLTVIFWVLRYPHQSWNSFISLNQVKYPLIC